MLLPGVSEMNFFNSCMCRIFYITLCSVTVAAVCGCRSAEKQQPPAAQNFPVEKALNEQRRMQARQLAQNYMDALNKSLHTGEFSYLAKELPRKLVSGRAKEIFHAMRKALERYGRMESCTFFGSLNGTLYADFLWKYRFVKPTGSAELPDQTVELLYRVRVIHPEQKPVIIKADFLR